MRAEVNQTDWANILREVNTHNFQRATRMEVIGEIGDVARDYWLENGVPFLGVSLEQTVADAPRFEVMLGGEEAGSGHLTHVVPNVCTLFVERNYEGQTDALELRDSQGNTTILRFETNCATAVAA